LELIIEREESFMKAKIKVSILGGLILLAVGMVAGCASTSTSTLYDNPNWMPDGRIICNKTVITTSQQFYGGGISGSHGYITAFWPSGTGEVDLFEGLNGLPICSPTGELIAFFGNDGITISDYQGHSSIVPNTSNVNDVDWSPDATRLVYSDSTKDLYIINRDGTSKTKIATSAEAVAWRVGNKIVFEDSYYNQIYSIYSDGSSKETIATIAQMPQIIQGMRVIYRGINNQVNTINIDGSNNQILFGNYDRSTLKLSFDDAKIVGGKTGDSGLWLINIDGTGYAKIR
jgi:hypothetical protein